MVRLALGVAFWLPLAGAVVWIIISDVRQRRRLGAPLLDFGRWTSFHQSGFNLQFAVQPLMLGLNFGVFVGGLMDSNATVLDFGYILLYCGWPVWMLIVWHRGTVICEHGLISPVRNVRWEQVTGYAWQGEHDRSLTVWTAPTRFVAAPHFELRIPARLCVALDALLRERLPGKRRAGKPLYQLDANGEKIRSWSGRPEPYPRTLPVGEAFYQPRTWNPFWWTLWLAGALIMFPAWCVQALADWLRGRTVR